MEIRTADRKTNEKESNNNVYGIIQSMPIYAQQESQKGKKEKRIKNVFEEIMAGKTSQT